MTISTEEFIRSRAKMGWSRVMVAEALGISRHKFRAIDKAMSDVKWPTQGRGLRNVQAYEASKGYSSPKRKACCARARAKRRELSVKFTVGCFTGTPSEVYDFWQDYAAVSKCQFRRRIKKGMGVLDALFQSNKVHKGWGNMPRMTIKEKP